MCWINRWYSSSRCCWAASFSRPRVFQRPGHESMLRLDHLVLTSRSFNFIGGAFSPLLEDAIQLGTLLLHTLGGGKRQL